MLKFLARAFMVATCVISCSYWVYTVATLKFLAK